MDKDVQRGFNSGYTLHSCDPEIAQEFMNMLKDRDDDYAVGFSAGIQERERELSIPKHRNYKLGKSRDRTVVPRNRNKDMDMDR